MLASCPLRPLHQTPLQRLSHPAPTAPIEVYNEFALIEFCAITPIVIMCGIFFKAALAAPPPPLREKIMLQNACASRTSTCMWWPVCCKAVSPPQKNATCHRRGLCSWEFWACSVAYMYFYGVCLLVAVTAPRGPQRLDALSLVGVAIWFFINLTTTATLLAGVRSGGVAIALVPRPGSAAALAVAAARLMPAGAAYRGDGMVVLPDRSVMAIPPGSHLLLTRDSREGGRWERALAYESCNGVLGVKPRYLRQLFKQAQDNITTVYETLCSFSWFTRPPTGIAGLVLTTGNINDALTRPMCERAAQKAATAAGHSAAAADPSDKSWFLAYQRSLYETFLRPDLNLSAPAFDSAECILAPATSFVSHAWTGSFEQLIEALDAEDARVRARDGLFHGFTAAFDWRYLHTNMLAEEPLIVERERAAWIDIVFKNQANAAPALSGEALERSKALLRRFNESFRRVDNAVDYSAFLDEDAGYSAATVAEFRHCIGSPGVVDSICNGLSRGEQPPALQRLWCLYEIFSSLRLGSDLRCLQAERSVSGLAVPAGTTLLQLSDSEGVAFEHIGRLLMSIDARDAVASMPQDLFMIFRQIRMQASFADVDRAARRAIVQAQELHLRDFKAHYAQARQQALPHAVIFTLVWAPIVSEALYSPLFDDAALQLFVFVIAIAVVARFLIIWYNSGFVIQLTNDATKSLLVATSKMTGLEAPAAAAGAAGAGGAGGSSQSTLSRPQASSSECTPSPSLAASAHVVVVNPLPFVTMVAAASQARS